MRKLLLFCLLSLPLLCFSANKRIVSLAASITKNLYAIGAGHELVGCTRFCITAPEDSIAIVADAINVNMEKIMSLRPDIVIASGLTPPNVLDGLNRLGVETVRLKEPCDFDEICEQCILLGKLSGREEAAKEIVNHSRERLREIKKSRDGKQPVLDVFMEIGCDPLFSALPGSFMHDYICQSGGRNIAEGLRSAIVSKEFVIMQNPDVILIVGMGMVGEEERDEWRSLNNMSAVRHKRIYILDQEICSPTPVSFVDTVEELAGLLTE